MTSFGYDPTPLHRVWRILTSSFSVGTFFSVQVRMYWVAVVVMPMIFLRWVPAQSAGQALAYMAICYVGLFVIIWTHEMGHIACAWRYRIRTDLITLGPLGGLAHLNAPVSQPRHELWIALAGPAVHLIWLAVLLPIQWLLPTESAYGSWYGFAVWYLVVTNTTLLLFNLLPVFPLDGGRALRALLAMRVHANRATMWAANIGIAGGILLAVAALTRPGLQSSVGLIIGLSCVLRSIDEKRIARHVLIYQPTQQQSWQVDPEAWKQGRADEHSSTPRQPTWLSQRRAARTNKAAALKRQQEAQRDAEEDAVLKRISQVGMSGLTDKEKTVLQRASRRRRGAS